MKIAKRVLCLNWYLLRYFKLYVMPWIIKQLVLVGEFKGIFFRKVKKKKKLYGIMKGIFLMEIRSKVYVKNCMVLFCFCAKFRTYKVSQKVKLTFTILFFFDRCGHCKKLAPEFEKLGTTFKKAKSVLIAKVSSL